MPTVSVVTMHTLTMAIAVIMVAQTLAAIVAVATEDTAIEPKA